VKRGGEQRVAYVSRLPPPGGGIATWTRIVFERGLPGGWVPTLVDARLTARRRSFESARLSPGEAWRTVRILASLLRELALRRPAIVHFNVGSFDLGLVRDLLGALLVRAFRVPVVLHYHGDVTRVAGTRTWRWVLARAVRVASLDVVVNETSLAFVRQLASGGTRVVSLPNFLDERAIPRSGVRARGPSEPARVLFVGNLTAAKGTPEVVAVAHALPEAEFHLFGEVADESRDVLGGAPSNVIVHGAVEHARILEAMQGAHLLLLPSEHEGFPYAVLEAMAIGLPVVATPAGAIPEMVEEGRGGFVRPRDARALGDAVREILRDEARRVAMGRFNQEKCFRLYVFAAVAPRLVELYGALAGTGVDAPGRDGASAIPPERPPLGTRASTRA
jgi:glycosyltransferase involved in cell wall biosynthesis